MKALRTAEHDGVKIVAIDPRGYHQDAHIAPCSRCYFGEMRGSRDCVYGLGEPLAAAYRSAPYNCYGVIWVKQEDYVVMRLGAAA